MMKYLNRNMRFCLSLLLFFIQLAIIIMMNQNEAFDDIEFDRVLEMQDFFPKIFLQPKEIRLDREEGIRVINRHKNQPDKYHQGSVRPIKVDEREIRKFSMNPEQGYEMDHPAGDGLISLFRRTKERRIKLAICICVYSEPKHMLKATIKGIQESNRQFLEKAGIMSHEIIVVTIFDGIEHLNSSKDQTQNMISLFSEIDIKNGFRARTNSMSLDEFLKQAQAGKIDLNSLSQDKVGQINLFTEDEFNDLQPQLFENQYEQYIKTKKLLAQICQLKKDKDLKLQMLPLDVIRKYEELCVNFCAENGYWFQTQDEIQEYLNNTRKNIKFKLIYEALCEVQSLCARYLESREDKVILYPVRMEKDDLKNPRVQQNAEQEFSSLVDQSEKKEYNYLFMCVKHKNSGKLNSHMLFFEGFCKLFDPEYCILMDVGVKPQGSAIFQMYRHLQLTPKCGGVCGYMSLKIENPSDDLGYRLDGYNEDEVDCFTRFFNYLLSIQRAQQFQYHYAHMLDKPFESFFDYIHVLPGAFSGYRWKALKSVKYKDIEDSPSDYNKLQIDTDRYSNNISFSDSEEESETLLKRYLKTAMSENLDLSLEDSNMYLAEDRILCLGIHALDYDLHYLPDVESYVDPVTSLTKLLGQRRRWINGSWFAFNYVKEHWRESTSCLFLFQLVYYCFVQGLQWIMPALFYIAMNLTLISFVTDSLVPSLEDFFQLTQDFKLGTYKIFYIFNVKQMLLSIPDIINFLYVIAVFSVILWSLQVNHNNNKFKVIYYGASTLLGIYGILVLSLLFYNTVNIIRKTTEDIHESGQFFIPLIYLRSLILFVVLGFALPIIWTLSFRKSVEMITSLISYIYFSPTYINILQTFAFCRIDDLSWGTKGLDSDSKDQLSHQWQRRKYIFVLQYVSTNVMLSFILQSLTRYDMTKNIIILISAALVVFLLAFRLFFALSYIIKYFATRRCKVFSSEKVNENRGHGFRIYNALKLIQLRIKEIQKEKTKKKKLQEYKNLTNTTSIILSKALSNFGKRIRNKVARHIVQNNMIPKKDILDPFKKRLKNIKRVSSLRKNSQHSLNPPIPEVQEKSDSREASETGTKKLIKEKPVQTSANLQIPESNLQSDEALQSRNNLESKTNFQESQSPGTQKKEIKKILKSIRQRFKSKLKSKHRQEDSDV